MRRIIERKVTVVTTTTWTISWQDMAPQASSEVDPVQSTESNTAAAPATPLEIKEADSESNDKVAQPDLTSKVINSHPSKPERK